METFTFSTNLTLNFDLVPPISSELGEKVKVDLQFKIKVAGQTVLAQEHRQIKKLLTNKQTPPNILSPCFAANKKNTDNFRSHNIKKKTIGIKLSNSLIRRFLNLVF